MNSLIEQKLNQQDAYMKYARITQYFSEKSRRMKIPFTGTFELTPLCNMNCKMCYIRMTKKEMDRVGTSLSTEEWIRIATEAVEQGMTMALFTGGEAILHPDFKKIYLAVRKMGVFVSVNTNGTTLTDEWIEFFKQYPPAKFNITIYGGCNETYERLCGNPKGFDQLEQTIEKLQENHFQILLNCTLTTQNVGDMERIYQFGRKHQLKIHATTYNFPPVRKEGVENLEVSRMTPTEAARESIRLNWFELEQEDFLKRMKSVSELMDDVGNLENTCLEMEGDKVLCAAGRANFWVTWDGRMLPCGMIPDFSVPMKGIPFVKAWKEIVEHTETITLAAECRQCPKKKLCAPCAAKLKAETGQYHQKSDYMCKYIDEYIRFAGKACQYLK